MSASLVGSEMCIRDRPCPCTWRAAPKWAFRLGPAQGSPIVARGKQRLVSVSYTHLTLPTICSV
eukprot:14516622-Alexandrium_andersonii.AAC.1